MAFRSFGTLPGAVLARVAALVPGVGIRPTVATYDPAVADVGTAGGESTTAGPSLPVGTHVEVRSGLDDTWEPGFVVHQVTTIGYRLQREMDGAILPELPHERVRRRRRRSTWWV